MLKYFLRISYCNKQMKKAFGKRIHLNYIKGLNNFVQKELLELKIGHLMDKYDNIQYIGNFKQLHKAKTINEVYLEFHSKYLNPKYLSNHKSIIGELIEKVFADSDILKFRTFSVSAAGIDSQEIQNIIHYISTTYRLKQEATADLKIEIGYRNNEWVIACRTTPRPLSLRPWRVCNIEGGMNPTIAYCMNILTIPEDSQQILNIFSGSSTLLIERANIAKSKNLIGFDYNGKTNACAIQNIKQAGLIKQISIKTLDIFDNPNLGLFNIVVTDLPFGIKIGKHEDLENLYKTTIQYILKSLVSNGMAIIYTSKYKILEHIFENLNIVPEKVIPLILPTSESDYLYPRIYKIVKA